MFKELPEGQTHSFNDGCGEKEHNCACKLASCLVNCSRSHTHKTFSCDVCVPKCNQIIHAADRTVCANEKGKCVLHDRETIDYVDSRNPEERANEPKSITTTTDLPDMRKWQLCSNNHLIYGIGSNECPECEQYFLHVLTDQINAILENYKSELLEKIERMSVEMKETHACRFNDGKQNCDCYLEALDDLKREIIK